MMRVVHHNNHNSRSRIKKFQHESEEWKRRLEILLQENTRLKNQLAEVLNTKSIDARFLDAAEEYLNLFIRKDEMIALMRHDIAAYDRQLKNVLQDDINAHRVIAQKNRKTYRDLHLLENNFHDLKLAFGKFIDAAA